MRPSSSASIACIASPRSGFHRFTSSGVILCVISNRVGSECILLNFCRRVAHTLMAIVEPITSLTISVFARHSVDCPKGDDPQWKRCKCRKSIYIREDGKTTYVSAKTRSWTEAEEVAQRLRDKRNP